MRILFCGLSGIPNKNSAPINRYLALAQAMSLNNEIIFINRVPIREQSQYKTEDNCKDFKIIDATGIKYRPKSFIKRNILKISSFIHEFSTIRKINQEKKIDWLNVYTQFFGICFFYFLLSKLFKFKIILHYVEFRSKIKNRNILFQVNDYLFDHYAIQLCDKIIPISSFLNEHVKKIKSSAKTLLVPPICDFEYFDKIKPELSQKNYFIFCGSASYIEVLSFILESYIKIKDRDQIDLHLVISGKISDQTIVQIINEHNNSIKIFSNIDYDKLISKYKGALAQLIPLRNTIQDNARFPQKICEYLASHRPIITTNFGEIPYYFVDAKNAVISEDFTTGSYTKKLTWAIQNPEKLQTISSNSYEIGKNSFEIKSYSIKLKRFLEYD